MNEIFENGYALLIGVGNNPNFPEDDLPESVNDANAIANVLSDPELAGYKSENITILVNDSADRKGILEALDRLINVTNEESTVFIFYSGHGGYSKWLDKYHLCPNGFDKEDHLPTWISAEEFQEKLNAIQSNIKVLFLDCCHAQGITLKGSDETVENDSKPESIREPELNNVDELGDKFFDIPNLSYISSCRAEQQSFILKNQNNSLFTQCLIEVLRGKHRKGFDDPYIRVTETLNYLLREVPAKVPSPYEQHPAFNIRGEQDLILSFAPKIKRKSSGSVQSHNDDFLIEMTKEEIRDIEESIKTKMDEIKALRRSKLTLLDARFIYRTDLQIMDEELEKEKYVKKWKALKAQIQ